MAPEVPTLSSFDTGGEGIIPNMMWIVDDITDRQIF